MSATFGGVQVRSGLSEVGWDQVWLRQNKRLSQKQSVWLLYTVYETCAALDAGKPSRDQRFLCCDCVARDDGDSSQLHTQHVSISSQTPRHMLSHISAHKQNDIRVDEHMNISR